MITVDVCRDCNAQKSEDDQYLRDVLVLDIRNHTQPKARAVYPKVERAAQSNRSLLARSARAHTQFALVSQPDGVRFYPFVPTENARIERELILITKGLYHHVFNQRLPDDCIFDVQQRTEVEAEEIWGNFQKAGGSGPYSIGNGVFGFAFIRDENDVATSRWMLCFYGTIFYTVATDLANSEV
jgi:hypothetical protein